MKQQVYPVYPDPVVLYRGHTLYPTISFHALSHFCKLMTKFTEKVTQLHLSRQVNTHTRSLGGDGIHLATVELDVLGELQQTMEGSLRIGGSLHRNVTPHFGAWRGVVEG